MNHRFLRPIALLALLCAIPLQAAAQVTTELDGTPLDTRTRRAWAGNYREFARYIAPFEDGLVVIPNYERGHDNSFGISFGQAENELKVTWKEKNGIVVQDRNWTPPREEVEAYTKLLPSLDLGTFGYIHSVEVVELLGPDQMLVTDLWILDEQALEQQYDRDEAQGRASGDRSYRQVLDAAYKRRLELADLQGDRDFDGPFRLVGYQTRGLAKGQRYTGPNREGFQIAFAAWDIPPQEEGRGRTSRRNAVRVLIDPASVMRNSATEQQFVELLGQKGMTIAGFVELVRGAREQDRDTADSVVLAELMPAGPDDEDK